MAKVKSEVIVIKDEDSDDDVINCKPIKIHKKCHKREPKKKERKVQRAIDTSSNTETLVVTQKVKKRKQKIQCIINLTNICEHREKPKQKVKTSTAKVNLKPPVKVDKVVPVCLRTRCRVDINRKDDIKDERKKLERKELERKELERKELKRKELERKELKRKELKRKELERKELKRKELKRKELERKELKRKELKRKELERKKPKEHCRRRKFDVSFDSKDIKDRHGRSNSGKCKNSCHQRASRPRRRSPSQTRYLSPVSSASLSDVLSECDEGVMSYEDISSDSTVEIDTLIKRTKDRERIHYNKDDIYNDHKFDYKQPSNSWGNSYDDKHTEKIEKLNYLQSFEKTESQPFHKSENAYNAANDRAKCDYTFNKASTPLISTDKPSNDYEQIDDQNKPMQTTTANIEDTFDASATDDGTVLTSEMDIVSFHSEGTLVLDVLYSPTESISVNSDAYSPTASPAFFYQQGGFDSRQSHRVPSPLISPAITPLMQNDFDEPNPTEKENDANKLETIIKQEQSISPMSIEGHIPEIDIAKNNASFVTNHLETTDVKVKIEYDPGKDNTDTTFQNKFSDVPNIKEEIDEDSMNNNIKLQPLSVSLYLSMMGTSKKCVDDNLAIKTIKKEN